MGSYIGEVLTFIAAHLRRLFYFAKHKVRRAVRSIFMPLTLMVCALAMSACDRDDRRSDQSPIDSTALEKSRLCHRQSNESRLQLLQSLDTPRSAEAVVAARRGQEQICLTEAACLDIGSDLAGIYLTGCLGSAEQNK